MKSGVAGVTQALAGMDQGLAQLVQPQLWSE
jgi:hypothetical protein